jgi:ATP-dependent DNA helicase RecG
MTRLTDHELEALLNDLESDRVERKEAWTGDAPDKGSQAICAFANDLPNHRQPGVLFVGADDHGNPSLLKITDQLLTTLADARANGNILPPPSMTVEKRTLKGADLAVVTVWPADAPPVRYRGRIWIRVGPTRRLATAQDERILSEKRRHHDIPFDIWPRPSAKISDLSRTFFEEEYLPGAFAPEILAANERSYEQRLSACRMIVAEDEPVPTVLGLLALSRAPNRWLPGAYIQFLRVQGTQWSDPIVDEAVLDGHLASMIRRLDEKMAAHNRVTVDFTSQDREVRRFLYPPVALQQLTRNAVMHRAYESTNAPIRAYWFDDRIEIMNPGGPFGNVTAANFGRPGNADYRNPHLAEAMRVLNLVQRFGVGIALAQAALRENGNPPVSFEVDESKVFARVFPATLHPH